MMLLIDWTIDNVMCLNGFFDLLMALDSARLWITNSSVQCVNKVQQHEMRVHFSVSCVPGLSCRSKTVRESVCGKHRGLWKFWTFKIPRCLKADVSPDFLVPLSSLPYPITSNVPSSNDHHHAGSIQERRRGKSRREVPHLHRHFVHFYARQACYRVGPLLSFHLCPSFHAMGSIQEEGFRASRRRDVQFASLGGWGASMGEEA